MKHTFLLEEGDWSASGVWADGEERIATLRGRCAVHHGSKVWGLESVFVVEAPEGEIRWENRYTIEPPGHRSHACWTATNPEIGSLAGGFTLVGDTVLSRWQADDGRHEGVEALIQKSPGLYVVRGALTAGNRRAASWSAHLTREN